MRSPTASPSSTADGSTADAWPPRGARSTSSAAAIYLSSRHTEELLARAGISFNRARRIITRHSNVFPPERFNEGGAQEERPMEGGRDVHPGLAGAWTLAEEVRRELLTAIRPLNHGQWAFRPGTRGWCIGEIVEHLLLAEIGSGKMVRKLIRGDYKNVPFPTGVTLWGGDLDRYPYGSLDAPHGLVPGSHRDRTILEPELATARERFREEVARFQGDDPEVLRSPDPATGEWFTLGGWVKLSAWHEKHHVDQIRRLMAAAGLL